MRHYWIGLLIFVFFCAAEFRRRKKQEVSHRMTIRDSDLTPYAESGKAVVAARSSLAPFGLKRTASLLFAKRPSRSVPIRLEARTIAHRCFKQHFEFSPRFLCGKSPQR
jgi:hypothetical protein